MKFQQTLWAGRTEGKINSILVQLGESISLDLFLYREDLKGSYAHAKMLYRIGILTEEELQKILQGLKEIQSEIENNNFPIVLELEDIHTHIEQRLKEKIGSIAGKLHTARSRNDQIATDTHLFVKRISYEIILKLIEICKVLIQKAEKTIDYIFPSYTHLQVAQPVRFAHYLLSYFWMFLRDIKRLHFTYQEADYLPLGCGAATGVNYPNDREFLKQELKFSQLYENSMDAVSSRDHILNFLYSISVVSLHLSRLCEEFILYSSVEFNFIYLPDELTTGSSIMPQKKNPDLAELIRGKTGKFIGYLNSLMITLKSLPLTYNRDLQEDREPLVNSTEVLIILDGIRLMLESFSIREEELTKSLQKGFATATDLADALVQEKKIPFREAHHIVGELVRICIKQNFHLFSVPKKIRKDIHPFLADDDFYYNSIDLDLSTEKKVSYGGTSRQRVMEQIQVAKSSLQTISIPDKPDLKLT